MTYEQKKAQLIKEIQQTKGNIALGKTTSNLFRYRNQTNAKKINVRNFNNIISIDTKKLIAEVEGMTPYPKLVQATLKHGLVPAFVPELKTITIGGEIAGIGIESSAFKYGFAHETILETEIILANGKIITCSPTKNEDLYYGFPNTYGTLGYVLKAKVQLIPAKQYIKLTRKKYTDVKSYLTAIQKASTQRKTDYIDGLIFSKNEMYLVLAEFVDNAPYTSDYKKEIYYKSFQTKTEDYVTTYDYLFRYDPDWFWNSRHFGLENPILRKLWGRKNLNSKLFYKLMNWNRKYKVFDTLQRIMGMKKTETLIQDAEVPIEQAEEFITWMLDNVGITPMMAVPVKPYKKTSYPMFPMTPGKLYMNIGFYDYIPSDKPAGYYDRLIEEKILKMGIKKMLYSTCQFTKEEFWKIFDKKTYDKLKKKYDPNNAFPNLYDKCVKAK